MDRYDFDRTNEALVKAGMKPLSEQEAGGLPPAPPPRPPEPAPTSAPVSLPPSQVQAPAAQRPEDWKRVPWPTGATSEEVARARAGVPHITGGRGAGAGPPNRSAPPAVARGVLPESSVAAPNAAPAEGDLGKALESARSPKELMEVARRAAAEGHVAVNGEVP